MSQRKTAIRHSLIIKKLRRQKYSTFNEICDYLDRESEICGEDLSISKRTFERDMYDIGELYQIDIEFDFSARAYFIRHDNADELANRRLEALDVFNALQVKERQAEHIFLDNRQAAGTGQLYGLLHAINNRLQIGFDYQTFYHENPVKRTVNPIVIKEFKYRWYLFAVDTYNSKVKCYGLDRMLNLQISSTNFEPPADFNLAERLQYCFGIVSPNAEQPSETVLSFNPFQGQYIKSLPLHDTQKIILDNADELRISLTVFLTHDFMMELLSYGDTVKVIQPQSLIDELKGVYERARANY